MDTSKPPGLELLLAGLELSATVFFRGWLCGRWHTAPPGRGLASFHLLVHGHAWLHQDDEEPVALSPGDILLFLKDVPYTLSHSRKPSAADEGHQLPLGHTPSSAAAALICGHFDFGNDRLHPLLATLPERLIIGKAERLGALDGLITALIDESSRDDEASELILNQLCEAFFRCILRQLPRQTHSRLSLLREQPGLARVLEKMHRQPSHPWSLDLLAQEGFFSRSRFVSLFRDFTGMSALAYLTRLRLIRAHKSLLAGKTVAQVADDSGYSDVAAFSKAYKRQFGNTPGHTRRHQDKGVSP